MMTCRVLVHRLDDLVAGALSPDDRAAADGHLGVCRPCAVLVETYRITVRLVRELPAPNVPPELAGKLEGMLAQSRSTPDDLNTR